MSSSRRHTVRLEHVPINQIYVDFTWNSRGFFLPETCYGLASDLKENGLLSPIMLRLSGDDDKGNKPYCLVYGHRRLTATALNNETEILAIINETMTKEEAKHANITENVGREEIPEYPFAQCVLWTFLRTGKDDVETARILGISPTEVWKHLRTMGIKSLDGVKTPTPDLFVEQMGEYLEVINALGLERLHKKKRIHMSLLLDTLIPYTKAEYDNDRFLQQYCFIKVLEENNLANTSAYIAVKALSGLVPMLYAFQILARDQKDLAAKDLYFRYCDLLITAGEAPTIDLLVDVRTRGKHVFRPKKKRMYGKIPNVIGQMHKEEAEECNRIS